MRGWVWTIGILIALWGASMAVAWSQGAIEFDLSTPEPSAAPAAASGQPPTADVKQPAPTQPQGKVIGRLGIITSGKTKAPIVRFANNGAPKIVSRCLDGSYVTVTTQKGKWLGVLLLDGSLGWIERKYIYLTEYMVVQPDAKVGAKSNGIPGQTGQWSAGYADQILQTASSMQGIPYVYGGSGVNGIDCSRFVQMVYHRVGIHLPRTAAEQANTGKRVEWSDLKPGDRIYFSMSGKRIDHCGIYAGGAIFIHASSNRGQVAFDQLDNPRYLNRLVIARR